MNELLKKIATISQAKRTPATISQVTEQNSPVNNKRTGPKSRSKNGMRLFKMDHNSEEKNGCLKKSHPEAATHQTVSTIFIPATHPKHFRPFISLLPSQKHF